MVVKLGILFADAIIVTSPECRSTLQKYDFRKKLVYIPNGVDTNIFHPSESKISKDTKIKYLFVGRLEPEKNLFMLLESLSRVKKDIPVELTIIGDGSLKKKLFQHAKSLNISTYFKGIVPHRDLPALMNKHDVFVLSSIREGHPKVLIEAMSCGMACVGTNVPGISSLISNGKNGLLSDLTVDSLAEKLIIAGMNPVLRKNLGLAARAFVVEHFDLNQLLEVEANLLVSLAK